VHAHLQPHCYDIGVNENRFSSKDIHIINGLPDEIIIIVDDIKILYVMTR